MSAATGERTPEEAARLVALYDAPGYLDVQRARAALWLLGNRSGPTQYVGGFGG